MNPIDPWLDPVEVRRLAARLMSPPRNPEVKLKDLGFDAGFVGYATSDSVSPAPPPQAPAAPAIEAMPGPASPVIIPEAVSFSAKGPFLQGIQRFRDWMLRHYAATGMFILDREGTVIFDDSSHGRLHFLARGVALASHRQGSSAGNVHVKIGAGATIEIIPAETPCGYLVLGAVVPVALPPVAITSVIEALSQIASPEAAR